MLKKLLQHTYIINILFFISKIIPSVNHFKKYKNIIKVIYSISKNLDLNKGNPINIRIAPINLCNYKCLFCEIHKDDLLYPKRITNQVDLNDIKKFSSFLSTAYHISFYGGSAEPLLNKDFGKIIIYLKTKYGIKMMVNTNASLLNENLSKIMVKYKFNEILVSYHAGSKELYKRLMTGNIEIVEKNISSLNKMKGLKKYPVINFNFALNKENAQDASTIIDKAKQFKVNYLLVNKYYGGRNKLQDSLVSYDYYQSDGNKVIDSIYEYAKNKKVKLLPTERTYWTKLDMNWDIENYDKGKRCYEPWKNLHFNPVLNEDNCFYVGVCNRIELFKINYLQCDIHTQSKFQNLWNHNLLRFLRQTVNSIDINPICKYCKNNNRENLRNCMPDEYAKIRDKAIQDFFSEFNKKFTSSEINGLFVLNENPHSDQRYKAEIEMIGREKACK